MSNIYPVPESFKETAHIDQQEYERIYSASIENNEQFWADTANAWTGRTFPPGSRTSLLTSPTCIFAGMKTVC